MSENAKTEIANLVEKAANAARSEDALRFSQAACNVANAIASSHAMKRSDKNDQ